MEGTTAVDGMNYEKAEVGAVPGWWCRPNDAAAGAAILYLQAAPMWSVQRAHTSISSCKWHRGRRLPRLTWHLFRLIAGAILKSHSSSDVEEAAGSGLSLVG
jgi:hypothetical protein